MSSVCSNGKTELLGDNSVKYEERDVQGGAFEGATLHLFSTRRGFRDRRCYAVARLSLERVRGLLPAPAVPV
jgi:hypothetical protein